MGCYVEVPNKPLWLAMNSDNYYEVGEAPKFEDFKKGNLPVVLVDNGLFKAAGIAFDKQEYERFTYPEDLRPKVIFSVALEKLKEVSDVEDWLKEEEE